MGLSKTQRSRLDIAVAIAEESDCKQKHGAVVYKGGRILSVGINKSHVNNKWLEGHPLPFTTHAEVSSLAKLSDKMTQGSVVYVARILRSGGVGYSRPCNACAKYLIKRGVKEVVYTT